MDASKLKNILEAGLLVAGRTLSIAQLEGLFEHDDEKPERKVIKEALESLKEEYNGRGIELVEVASGYRLQSHESVSDWVANLFQEKTPRYSRALLETLVLIAYRQPITRAEIEDVRGVAVSSNIIKTLQERQWVKVLGHKEVPGRPALLGTTKDFLDYFNLKKLDDLPSLADIKDLDQFDELLAEEAGEVDENAADEGSASDEGTGVNESDDDSGEHTASQNDDSASDPDESVVTGDDAVNKGAADIKLEGSDTVSGETDNLATDDSGDNASGNDDQADGDDESAELESGAESESIWNAGSRSNAAGDDDSDVDAGESAEQDLADGAVDATAESQEEAAGTDSQSDSAADDEGEPDPDLNETLSGPELELLRVISDFSDEHQQEIDARDALEEGLVSTNDDESEDVDVGDLSQRLSDDRNSGDMPEPGDTLH